MDTTLPVREASDIARELRAALSESGLRTAEVAYRSGVGEGAILKVLNGASKAPSAMTLLRLMVVVPGLAERLGFRTADAA
jgi:transcriptional regulator with XRE-family HTH domain